MASAKNQPPVTPLAPFVAIGGLVVALLASWAEYPGGVVLWFALFLCSFFTVRPVMNDQKTGQPENEHERSQLRKFQAWKGLRTAVWNPLPAFRAPLLGIGAAAIGVCGALLPVVGADWWIDIAQSLIGSSADVPHLVEPASSGETSIRVLNGVALAMSAVAITSSIADANNDFEPVPLGTMSEIRETVTGPDWQKSVTMIALTFAVCIGAGSVALPVLAASLPDAATWLPSPVLQGAMIGTALASAIAIRVIFSTIGPPWRRRVDTSTRWRSVFSAKDMKFDQPPTTVRSDRYDEYDLDVAEFSLVGRQADSVFPLQSSIAAAYGDGTRDIVLLHSFQPGDDGQPSRAQVNPFAFRVAIAPVGQWPSLSDRSTPLDVAQVSADVAAVKMLGEYATAAPTIIAAIEPCVTGVVTDELDEDAPPKKRDPLMEDDGDGPGSVEPTGPQVWQTTAMNNHLELSVLDGSDLPGFGDGAGFLYATGDESGFGDLLWLGAVENSNVDYDDQSVPKLMADIALIRLWKRRWKASMYSAKLRPDDHPLKPSIPNIREYDFCLSGYGPDGRPKSRGGGRSAGKIEVVPFGMRFGADAKMFFDPKIERAMLSAVANDRGRGAQWFHIFPWTDQASMRKQAASANAIRVAWSATDIFASPATIPSSITPPKTSRADASETLSVVMGTLLSRGFDAAPKMGRPRLVSVKNLTGPGMAKNIWQAELGLDTTGATIPSLMSALPAMQQAMMCDWMAVTTTNLDGKSLEAGCYLLFGAKPSGDVEFSGPQAAKASEYVQEVLWEQSFSRAGLISETGQAPKKISITPLPKNPKVIEFIFSIPPGKSDQSFKEAIPKLKPATGNSFMEFMPSEDATKARYLACFENPVPFPAPIDWDEMLDKSWRLAFGTGVDGTTSFVDHNEDPHLLVLGGSGSGKSANLMMLLESALLSGGEVYLADPTKGGTDFTWALPWLNGFAGDNQYLEALELVESVYAEGMRRNALRVEYNVSHVRDLPTEVRPKPLYLFFDEVTSYLQFDDQSKITGKESPEEAREIEELNEISASRRQVGKRFGDIVRELRAADVHLVLAGQKLDSPILKRIPGGSSIKSSMAVLALGLMPFSDLQAAVKRPSDVPKLAETPRGRGVFEGSMPPTQIIQSWWVAEDGQAAGPERVKTILMEALDREGIGRRELLDLKGMVEKKKAASPQTGFFGEEVGDEVVEQVEEDTIDLMGDFDFSSIDFGTDSPASESEETVAVVAPEPEPTGDPAAIEPEPEDSAELDEAVGSSRIWIRGGAVLTEDLPSGDRDDVERMDTALGSRWASPSFLMELAIAASGGASIVGVDMGADTRAALSALIGFPVSAANEVQVTAGGGVLISVDGDSDPLAASGVQVQLPSDPIPGGGAEEELPDPDVIAEPIILPESGGLEPTADLLDSEPAAETPRRRRSLPSTPSPVEPVPPSPAPAPPAPAPVTPPVGPPALPSLPAPAPVTAPPAGPPALPSLPTSAPSAPVTPPVGPPALPSLPTAPTNAPTFPPALPAPAPATDQTAPPQIPTLPWNV